MLDKRLCLNPGVDVLAVSIDLYDMMLNEEVFPRCSVVQAVLDVKLTGCQSPSSSADSRNIEERRF